MIPLPPRSLLHHVAKVMPHRSLVTIIGPHGPPRTGRFVVLAAVGGVLIGLILRLLPLPDLLTGAVIGLAAGSLVPRNWRLGTPARAPLVPAARGRDTALLRPLALGGNDEAWDD